MDHLTKQQIVLLTLLVSFVTSLATGIITVSLMDQAPQGMTQTITKVVERTIANAVALPESSLATVVVSPTDRIAQAVDMVSKSTVKIRSHSTGQMYGLGLLVSKKGIIISDKSILTLAPDAEAIFPDGVARPLTVIQSQVDGDIIFLTPMTVIDPQTLTPISYVHGVTLGQDVFSLGGTSNFTLGQGLVTGGVGSDVQVASGTPAVIQPVMTSIPSQQTILGGALFNIHGQIIGIRTSSLSQTSGSQFYPVSALVSAIPKI